MRGVSLIGVGTQVTVPFRLHLGIGAAFLAILMLTAPSARATSGFDAVDNGGNRVLRGTRVDVNPPSQYNILSGNFGLEFVRSQGGTTGLIQTFIIQYNNKTLDLGNGSCTGPAGQLFLTYEYRVGGQSTYHCDNISTTDGSRKTLRVERTTSGDQFWASIVEGTIYFNHDINYNGAEDIYIGGELYSASDVNGNTTVCANYGSGSGAIPWDRTDEAFDGTNVPNWTKVQTRTFGSTDGGRWVVDLPPTPLEIYWNANPC